ncbi:protein obstructor-E-like isoform X1 [Periplaneta americana]|uniref:protein obstructor-E-like isoform X1 n=1 Tax=Periplaneta americana TaxID=6978 RepID=UPI0037E80664
MLLTTCSVLLLAGIAAIKTASGAFTCPGKYGQYPDPKQCDKFYECDEGVPREKLCPDGLMFDPENRKTNKCDQPFNVDCGDRIELQPPKPNQHCPRKNGYFAHPDPAVCHLFYNCIDGEHTEVPCTPGLHFDEYQGTCVWPESSGRTGCSKAESKLKDGFECPKDGQVDRNGQAVAHPKFAHPEDCQKFYVCLNGVQPRELGCSLGEVYNEEDQKCDAPENVPGCEDWYKDHPNFKVLYHDADGDGKKDFGDRRIFDQVNVNQKRN